MKDKIFKINYNKNSKDKKDVSGLRYVMLKVSKIKSSCSKENIKEKLLLQIIDMDNKVLYNEAKAE